MADLCCEGPINVVTKRGEGGDRDNAGVMLKPSKNKPGGNGVGDEELVVYPNHKPGCEKEVL